MSAYTCSICHKTITGNDEFRIESYGIVHRTCINQHATVHLQSVGNVPAVKASELRVGDRLMWNFGQVSQVERITPNKSGTTLTIDSLGSKYQRKIRATTLVARVSMSRHNDYWWNYDTNEYPFDFQYLEAVNTASPVTSAMIYRPQLEPLSHEDFSAQYNLIAALDLQLVRSIVYRDQMRQQFGGQ